MNYFFKDTKILWTKSKRAHKKISFVQISLPSIAKQLSTFEYTLKQD